MTFDVTIDQTNTPVSEGETLIVDYTVTNTGSSSDTQTIELHIISPSGQIIDSFEDGDIAEYVNGTDNFQVVDEANVTPAAIDGTMLLEATSQGEINSTSGLDNYFSKGETAHVYVYGDTLATDSMLSYTFFGSSSTALDGYALSLTDWSGENVRLIEYTDGSSNILDTANPSVSDATWYRLEITWDDGSLGGSDNDITVDVYDDTDTNIATVSANDSTHATNSGIGFRGQEGGWFWDYYHKP